MFTSVIRFGELEVDILHRRVRVDGQDVHLTPLELSLLYLLAANAGRILTRDDILDHLWGHDYAADRSAPYGRNSRTTGGVPGTSPRYPARVTNSC
jgi:DNA-binding response OmpR family regulator